MVIPLHKKKKTPNPRHKRPGIPRKKKGGGGKTIDEISFLVGKKRSRRTQGDPSSIASRLKVERKGEKAGPSRTTAPKKKKKANVCRKRKLDIFFLTTTASLLGGGGGKKEGSTYCSKISAKKRDSPHSDQRTKKNAVLRHKKIPSAPWGSFSGNAWPRGEEGGSCTLGQNNERKGVDKLGERILSPSIPRRDRGAREKKARPGPAGSVRRILSARAGILPQRKKKRKGGGRRVRTKSKEEGTCAAKRTLAGNLSDGEEKKKAACSRWASKKEIKKVPTRSPLPPPNFKVSIPTRKKKGRNAPACPSKRKGKEKKRNA